MSSIGIRSMRLRMTLYFSLIVAVIMAAVCGGWGWYAPRSAAAVIDARLRSAASRVTSDIQAASREDSKVEARPVKEPGTGKTVETPPTPLGGELVEDLRDLNAENLATVVVSPSGSVVAKSRGELPLLPLDRDRHTRPAPDRGGRWRIIALPIKGPGGYRLIIGAPWADTENALRRQAAMLFWISLLVVGVTAAGSWALVGRTLSPIGRLAAQARSASTESLALRLEPPSRDHEVLALVTTLNDLLSGFSETAAVRGRFYAAASHELRTPLQALSGHLELALQRLESESAARPRLEEALVQSRRLIALVRDLLFLNQLDTQSTGTMWPSHVEPISIAACVDLALAEVEKLIEERGLRVTWARSDDLEICAPYTHVSALVRNLVENAAKYSPAGGKIEIEVRARSRALIEPSEPSEPYLRIINSTEALDPETAVRLSEPFYRPDPSRSSAGGGNGLGLAICKAVSQANGWKMTLSARPEGVLKNSPSTPSFRPRGVYGSLAPLSPPGLGVGGPGAGTSPAFSTLTEGLEVTVTFPEAYGSDSSEPPALSGTSRKEVAR